MRILGLVLCLLCLPVAAGQQGVFLTPEALRQQAFGAEAPNEEVLWLTPELKQQAEAILGHRYAGLRIRYWGLGQRSAWILEEIGKELPITIGLVVDQDRLLSVAIMEYRESRGGEVRYPFFTRQFEGRQLQPVQSPPRLDAQIDGITGATLSVKAVTKVATLALWLHQQTPYGQVP